MFRFALAAALAIVLAALAPACNATPEPRPATPAAPQKSLYERLGGEKAIAMVVDEFLARVTTDPRIARRFDGVNAPRLRQLLIEQIGQASGGPQRYTGRDMKTVHKGMGIADAEFDALVEGLAGALDKFKVPEREKGELLGALAPMRRDIVEPPPTVEERLARIESQLARIEAALASRGPEPAARPTPPKPGMPAKPEMAPKPEAATKGTLDALIVDPAVVLPPDLPPPPAHARPWSAEEKALGRKLIERYESAAAQEPAEPKSELLGAPLLQTRFFSSTGDVFDLRDLRGKKNVLLVILRGFAGQVCINCSAQTLAIAKKIEEFRKRDVEVIVVYPGRSESLPVFLEAVRDLEAGFVPPFPVVLDVDLAAVRTFRIEGSLAKPTTLLLDRGGTVRYAYVGSGPADRPSAKQLLEAIDRVLPGRKP